MTALFALILPGAGCSPQQARGETLAVTGVEDSDVLNVRDEPSVKAAVVGTIPPHGRGIIPTGKEKKVRQSTWREVRYGALQGWVNSRYLVEDSGGQLFREDLRCLGTEPHWSLRVTREGLQFDLMGEKMWLSAQPAQISANHNNVWFLEAVKKPGGESAAIFLRKTNRCSDNMSDHVYRYEVVIGFSGEQVFSGCCNRLD